MLTTAVAATLFLTQPPMFDVVPLSRILPAIWVVFMLIIALHSAEPRRQRKLPVQIEVPSALNADWGGGKAELNKR
ncbi:hypothetical protein FF011L_37380 [Roseimaritima multifibrata]|uniref:Uncharacterized protein n=1 Tax=Roseimaritima multifibrata TaxID=1930274 RepID=A0A517MJC5_9BACT|nr:hypothetical protein FF011L_37380 [Roseimaritima multifibrata]